MSKWLAALILSFIVSVSVTAEAKALDEYISEIAVPVELSLEMQGLFQGYIMYSIEETPTTYVVKMARDGEPHQYPVFYATFDKNWTALSKTGMIAPKPPEPPKPVEQPKPEPTPTPTPQPTPEPPKPQPEPPKPEKPEKPDEPPVAPRPEEPEPEEPNEETETSE